MKLKLHLAALVVLAAGLVSASPAAGQGPPLGVEFLGQSIVPTGTTFAGTTIGGLSSIVVTTGPVATPFFLAYGLRRAAYIGTESVCTMVMHFTRGAVFARYALLSWDMVALGCVLGGSMFFGTWAARRLLDRMSERVFLWIVEALLVLMGLQLLLFPR